MAALLAAGPGYAQSSYTNGQKVANLPISKIINSNATTLDELRNNVTILDFFGTWCVPCIKALPHLAQLQNKFPGVRIVLVSNEPEEKLKKFIAARSSFSFPVIVDSEERFTAAFAPPAYPYSVVLNAAGTVLFTTSDIHEVTEAQIQTWLVQKMQPSLTIASPIPPLPPAARMQYSNNTTVRLSQEAVYAAKTGENTAALQKQLANLDEVVLATTLTNDADKKAFWINLYNAYTQILLQQKKQRYQNRSRFFGDRIITIAGRPYSLDDIEHAILRRGRTKWSWGYITNPFLPARFKRLRVNKVDYRIHFALNCGAKSCPPIAFYSAEKLDTQLNLATANYLTSSVQYNAATKEVWVPRILSWFRADFGGKKGIRKLLTTQGLTPAGTKPRLRFSPYDWTLSLNNFKTE